MENCIFCKIVNKEIPADIIYEDDDVICFLPKDIEVYGHTLVVPKKHYVSLDDIPADVLSELIKVAQKLTLEYKKKIGATGMNLLHASGADAQQEVFHFHLHLFPRFENDGIDTWPRLEKVEIKREELWKKLRIKRS